MLQTKALEQQIATVESLSMWSYGARCHCGLGHLGYNHTYSLPLCIQLINWQIPTTYHLYSQTQGIHKKYKIHLTGMVESTYESPRGKDQLISIQSVWPEPSWQSHGTCSGTIPLIPLCHDFHGNRTVPTTLAWPQADLALVTLAKEGQCKWHCFFFIVISSNFTQEPHSYCTVMTIWSTGYLCEKHKIVTTE